MVQSPRAGTVYVALQPERWHFCVRGHGGRNVPGPAAVPRPYRARAIEPNFFSYGYPKITWVGWGPQNNAAKKYKISLTSANIRNWHAENHRKPRFNRPYQADAQIRSQWAHLSSWLPLARILFQHEGQPAKKYKNGLYRQSSHRP